MKKTTVILSLVVVGIFLLSGFSVATQAPGVYTINRSKPRTVENYVVESAHSYTNNYDYTWTITKSGASKIRIHFTSDTEVENNYDFLYLYDGSGTQIWKKTGVLGAFWTEWVNGDTIKVRLTTDYSVTKYGFKVDQRDSETSSSDIELSAGVAYSDSLSAAGDKDYYKINVPSGSTSLDVVLDGPASGCDFDLYVKYNERATTSSYDGKGYTSSADETVTINSPSTGYYYIMPYSYSGSGSYTIKATVTSGGGGTTLGDAVDNTALSWTTGGNADWAVDTSTSYYGGNSAKSGTITHNQNTYIQTIVTGPGTLTFYWKVSSESNYDYLRFYIDGTEQTKISGSVSWAQKSYSISSGSHTLQWKYTKDGSVSSGSDCGWLDKALFAGGDTTPPTISNVQASSITSSSATITWTTDEASSSVVEYGTTTSYGSTATGSDGVTSHSVSLSGLSAGTTYHYRVKSTDSSENIATSGDYTFTTASASSDTELSAGVAYSDSLSAAGDKDYYKINVPSGSTSLDVVLDGPASGCDFDLYVKYNERATTSSYDGKGYTSSADETVTINSPSTGYYYIMPYSYSGSGSYTITATVTGGGGGGAVTEITLGVPASDSMSASGEEDHYKVNVGSGNTALTVTLDGPGSGADFDLYVKYNSQPTTSSYDARGYTGSADETCTVNNPSSGYYYIMVRAYSGSGAYTLTATVTSGGGTGDKYAVIVGINDYNYISDLSYCVNDANDWKPYLETQGYTISTFLTNSQATETAIKNAIANAISQAGSTGTVAFIFSGHGGKYSEAGLSGEGSVCYCYDGSTSSGTSGNLQDTELQSCFSGYTGKLFIFLDSCRSGGMNEVINSANRYMATTCGPNGYGYDEPSYLNGAWTYWFLEKGLVNSGSGHTDIEGNFNWAKNNYPYTGDDAPMQFDGDTSSLFYL